MEKILTNTSNSKWVNRYISNLNSYIDFKLSQGDKEKHYKINKKLKNNTYELLPGLQCF